MQCISLKWICRYSAARKHRHNLLLLVEVLQTLDELSKYYSVFVVLLVPFDVIIAELH